MIDRLADVRSKHIGNKTYIWQYCVVLEDAIIGKNCNINSHVFIEGDVVIADNVTVKSGVQLWNGLRLEDNVFIGPNVTFTNDKFPRSKQYPHSFLRTFIKENASIGANSTILCGLTIGENALIGAGSVVTKNIPGNTLWYGNPAIFKGYVCDCGEKLTNHPHCLACGTTKIYGKNITLRLIELSDLNFIFNMRQNKNKTKYLSDISEDIQVQKKWIEAYKDREKEAKEYYFIIESKQKEELGLVRIYDLQKDSFSWGSWLIKDDAPNNTGIESVLQIYEFAFYRLSYCKSHFEVRKDNLKVNAFHLRFGAVKTGEDNLNFYYEYTKTKYEKIREKYKRYLS